MDCLIQVLDEAGVRVVRVAGRLSAVHVPDLLAACSQSSGALRVDLSDVLSVDVVAVEALGRVRGAGAQLVGVPRYIEFKLESLAARPRGI